MREFEIFCSLWVLTYNISLTILKHVTQIHLNPINGHSLTFMNTIDSLLSSQTLSQKWNSQFCDKKKQPECPGKLQWKLFSCCHFFTWNRDCPFFTTSKVKTILYYQYRLIQWWILLKCKPDYFFSLVRKLYKWIKFFIFFIFWHKPNYNSSRSIHQFFVDIQILY